MTRLYAILTLLSSGPTSQYIPTISNNRSPNFIKSLFEVKICSDIHLQLNYRIEYQTFFNFSFKVPLQQMPIECLVRIQSASFCHDFWLSICRLCNSQALQPNQKQYTSLEADGRTMYFLWLADIVVISIKFMELPCNGVCGIFYWSSSLSSTLLLRLNWKISLGWFTLGHFTIEYWLIRKKLAFFLHA